MAVSRNRGVHGCPKRFFFGSKSKAWGTRILRQSQIEKNISKNENKQKMKNKQNLECQFGASLLQPCTLEVQV